jgi:hypothetical protein
LLLFKKEMGNFLKNFVLKFNFTNFILAAAVDGMRIWQELARCKLVSSYHQSLLGLVFWDWLISCCPHDLLSK